MSTEEQRTKHPGWGGARAGAGRKRLSTGRHHDVPHRKRPTLDGKHPVHVVLRLLPELRLSLRNGRTYRALRTVLFRYASWRDFRVVHISIQANHVHLLVEAADERALRGGMQSFAINAARAINASLGGRVGKVFAYRYHATQIRTARHARHALAYVLNNWRRHRRDLEGAQTMAASLDPYASGLSHPAWGARFTVPACYEPLPVSSPRTWLLRVGWKRHGELDPWETPALWQQTQRLS